MKRSTLKNILIAAVVIVLLVLAIIGADLLEHKNMKAPEGAGTASIPVGKTASYKTISIGDRDYYLNPDISTLLLIGTDDMELEQHEGYRNQALADYLALVILDNEEKTCTILQIDRNTMASIPVLGNNGKSIGTTTQQICYAHVYGDGLELSCENTVDTVSQLLRGVPIENYLSLTMGSIPALNDAVGGVTVTIEDDFTGVDDTLIKGETVHLMGEHAYNFVHERMRMIDDDSNTSRMRRQAAYVTALAEVLREKTETDDSFVLDLYEAVADYLVTDCELDTLADLTGSLADYSLEGFISLEGENVKKEHVEFYPDEQKLQQLVIALFCLPEK